jgi:LssY C-terminus
MKAWHRVTLGIVAMGGALIFWLLLAYGELPRLWSSHEHKLIGERDQIISYTSQDIPADPINIEILASEDAILCSFRRDGWSRAAPVTLRSSLGIVASVLFARADAAAPVSPLYFQDRLQDLAFEIDDGRSAARRHHVRLWRVTTGRWIGAATFDRGVGLSLYTLQVTHHIGPDVDAERDRVGALLQRNGGRYVGGQISRISPNVWHRNGGGDLYRTDGLIKAYAIGPVTC